MKYVGNVCFGEQTVETRPGFFEQKLIVKQLRGELDQYTRRYQNSSNGTNKDASFSMSLRLVADPTTYKDFLSILWVEHMGVKWSVESVTPTYPSVTINLGGIYNETSGE